VFKKKRILVLRHVWSTNVNDVNYFRRTALSHRSAQIGGGTFKKKKNQKDAAQIFLYKQTGKGIFQQPDTHREQIFFHTQIRGGTIQLHRTQTESKYSSTSRLGKEYFNNQTHTVSKYSSIRRLGAEQFNSTGRKLKANIPPQADSRSAEIFYRLRMLRVDSQSSHIVFGRSQVQISIRKLAALFFSVQS
jgi:hypothetical protein